MKIPTIIDYNKFLDSTSTKERPVVNFTSSLEVNYLNEGESVIFQRQIRARIRKAIQASYINSRARAELLPDGRLQPVNASQVSGYWSWELMSETLPIDYDPEDDLKIVKKKR